MKTLCLLAILCFGVVDSPSSGYRDGNGKVFGFVENNTVRDANRRVLGYIQNGKTLDANRNVICRNGELPGLLFKR